VDNEDEGAQLTRREENRELIAKHRATVEPRGCPTPGACSAVEELADLKQRLLPQYLGRAQRAEHQRDALLEQLIAARKTINQIKLEWEPPPSATAATDRPDWARQLPGAELYDRDHGYDRTASLSAGHYVCTCAAGRVLHEKTCATRRPDAREPR